MHFLEVYRHSARDVWSCFLYHWYLLRGHLLFTMRSGRQCSVLRFLRQRNDVYAFRNQFMFVIGILAPVICGILMGRCHGRWKVWYSKLLYLSAVCVFLLQAAAIKKIPVKQQEEGKASAEAGNASSRFSVSDLLEAITSVGKIKHCAGSSCRWSFLYHLAA